ncbi:MAG: hypothetical protein ACTHKE_06445 [Sphingomicrobium sp.]
MAVATGLRAVGLVWPCTHKTQTEFGVIYEGIPFDQCYKMDPPRRWAGLWRNEFEGSQFCPAPATNCGYDSAGKKISPSYWLEESIRFPEAIKKRRFGGLYAIEFDGRKPTYPGAYGHMGMSDQAVIVDRLISIREVEAPPKPSQADLQGMIKGCRMTPHCSVEELVKVQTEN